MCGGAMFVGGLALIGSGSRAIVGLYGIEFAVSGSGGWVAVAVVPVPVLVPGGCECRGVDVAEAASTLVVPGVELVLVLVLVLTPGAAVFGPVVLIAVSPVGLSVPGGFIIVRANDAV